MRRTVVIFALIAGLGVGVAGPAGADELPQAEQWVDELPEVVDPLPAVEPVEPVGDLLIVDEETGGLSATGWFLLVLILVVMTAPAWLLWAVPAAFVAIASAIGWRAAGHVGRRRMQRRLDYARANRWGQRTGAEPF